MSEWREVRLGDVCSLIADSEHKTAPKDPDGDFPLVRTSNLGNASIDLSKAQRISGATYEAWTRRAVPSEGDLILAREAPVGGIGRVPKHASPALGQRTVLLRPGTDIDSRFLLYRLAAPDMQARMSEAATGATVPHLNMADIRALAIPNVPPLEVQQRIGLVLAAFDELIEVSERRIELLEDLARSLYREWFVRNGQRYPTDSLSTIIEINPRVTSDQGTFRKVAMADVDTRFSMVVPSEEAAQASGSKFGLDDVLFARITPCLENGKTALVKFLDPGEMGIGSTEFVVLRGRIVGPAFTYCAARSPTVREPAIKSMSGASGRQRVRTEALGAIEIPRPDSATAQAFEERVGPMLELVHQLASHNRALTRTRDLLLPRLVTGELDGSDLELGALLRDEVTA